LTILTAPETTEVIYGADNIVSKTVEALSGVKSCFDGCYDSTAASMVVSIEPVWKAINELAGRGVRLRYITDITGDNIVYCKMFAENGCHLRHVNGIKSNFAIADRMEYMATGVIQEEKSLWQAILSNARTFVEGQQSLFDTLWNKALPAEQRIREIEEGHKPEFTETITDPSEIQNRGFELVKSAKEEITILFSTANGFKRQERAGLMLLLLETDPTVKVRILLPVDSALENTMKDKFDQDRRIETRYFLKSSPQTLLTSLTTDKKLCIVVELKDDTKDNSYEAVRSATYSNSESFVWTNASIFETLWMQAELDDRRRIDQKIS
jgi:hypothetical protein